MVLLIYHESAPPPYHQLFLTFVRKELLAQTWVTRPPYDHGIINNMLIFKLERGMQGELYAEQLCVEMQLDYRFCRFISFKVK